MYNEDDRFQETIMSLFKLYLEYDVTWHFQKQLYNDTCHHIPTLTTRILVVLYVIVGRMYVSCENVLHTFY